MKEKQEQMRKMETILDERGKEVLHQRKELQVMESYGLRKREYQVLQAGSWI